MEFIPITEPDEELYQFYQRQKTYFSIDKKAITRESVAEDFLSPEGFGEENHVHEKVYEDSQMIAYIDYYKGYRYSMRHEDTYVWIGLFLVEEAVQGQQYGTAILSHLLDSIPFATHVQLGCIAANEKGLCFWKSLGFHQIDTSIYDGQALIVMEKQLRSV